MKNADALKTFKLVSKVQIIYDEFLTKVFSLKTSIIIRMLLKNEIKLLL